MVEPQSTRFWQDAIQSGLVEVPALKACWEKIPPAKRTADAADRRLARQAVDAGCLTVWQAQQIINGRSSGFKIDKYILLDRIGTGGMGRVYLARDTRLGRRVAIKLMAPERLSSPRALARFLREAKVGAQLQHENLVRIYDEGDANGVPYLVMEYIEGKTIYKMITDDGPMDPALAAGLARQVALGLQHANLKGMIHRDVNPLNIMVTRDGVAKLMDLGLALDTGDDEVGVTRDGVTVGTFDYISPEQARHSRNVDTRTDIYSLGCTLYHMLGARVPFPMPSLPEKLYAHQLSEPEPLSVLAPGTPQELEDVVRRMMRKNPDDRYPTPLAVAMALEPFQGQPSISSRSGSSPVLTQVPVPPASADRKDDRPGPDPVSGPRHSADSHLAESPIPTSSGPGGGRPSHPAPAPSGSSPRVVAVEPAAVAGPVAASSTSREGPGPVAGPAADLIEVEEEAGEGSDAVPVARPVTPFPSRSADDALRESARGGRPERYEPHGQAAAVREEGIAAAIVGLVIDDEIEIENEEDGQGDGDLPVARPSQTSGEVAVAAVEVPILSAEAPILESLRDPASKGGLARILINVVAGILVLALGTVLVVQRIKQWSAPVEKKGGRLPGEGDGGRGKGLDIPKGAAIAVRLPDGTVREVKDFREALEQVASGGGEIALSSYAPLPVNKVEGPVVLSGGKVTIKPAKGAASPVILLDLTGTGPLLKAKAGGSLAVDGLFFAVTLQGKSPSSIIEAEGELDLTRCLFMSAGAGEDARAVVASGPRTTIEGCGFRGFDRPVDLALAPGARVALSQCLMAWSKADARKSGWAVRVRPSGDGKGPRQVSLDHCTVAYGGPIEVGEGFTSASPLAVSLRDSAVLADAVLLWGPPPGEFPKALSWEGQGNRYDIQKVSWVVKPPQGFDGLSGSPTDPASWEKVLPETGTVAKSFKLAAGSSPSDVLDPSAYALTDKDAGGVGADPARVGIPGR